MPVDHGSPMATATTARTSLTYEDLIDTPHGDGKRYEILGGELFVSAPPSKRHAWISFQLALRLAEYVEQRALGVVFHAPVDVRLTHNDVVVPDVIFLSTARRHLFGEQRIDGAPDLVVEVLSPSTRSRDLTAKLQLYAQTGVQEYWIVDQVTATVTLYWRAPHGSYELISSESDRVRSRVVPGFELETTELIAGLD